MQRAHPSGGVIVRERQEADRWEQAFRGLPPKNVQVVRTEVFGWPQPLEPIPHVPAVVVVDPTGKVVREYAAGVYDQKLYADLLDLMDGGTGDAWATPLPMQSWDGDEGPGAFDVLKTGLGVLLFIALLIFGGFYYPAAFLLVAAFGSGKMPFMYPAGIRVIGVAAKDYCILAAMVWGLELAIWLVGVVIRGGGALLGMPTWMVWFPAQLASMWLLFYTMLVVAYGIGRFYHANEEAIGWFTAPGGR